MEVRRSIALRTRKRATGVWPIMPGSEQQPQHWPGWPDGKKFAFVLTHDVETTVGLEKCRDLMQLDMDLGFRSSFNLVPEGDYKDPRQLREELTQNGFEVGIHDLRHDGRLYQSDREFRRNAASINRYLAEWGAVGFRSAFMLHKLDWLHQLNVAYDASTFDTDPFEPQPEGRNTIFPFWVLAPNNQQSEIRNQRSDPSSDLRHSAGRAGGYVELPYTLPQDSTLFLLLRETTPKIWMQKLDWIAEHGGMVLLNTHPDYMSFDGSPQTATEYPVAFYREFLTYLKTRYAGEYWHALPHEVARHVVRIRSSGKRHQLVSDKTRRLRGKRVAVLLFSRYPADPRPTRAAEALAAHGAQVDVICLRDGSGEAARETYGNINVTRVPLKRERGGKLGYVRQYVAFLLTSFFYLTSRSLTRRYHLVHVHNMPDVLVFAAIVPKVLGAKIVLDLHDPMPELMMTIYNLGAERHFVRWLKRLEKLSISFAHLILTPNKAFQGLFISRGCPSEKIQIIMNSPESNIFHPSKYDSLTPTSANGEKPFKIMYHGLIAERHGLDTALEAIARLRSVIPTLEFHIFGERTPYMNKVDAQMQKLGLRSCVHYRGYRPQIEIAKSIRLIDLGIIPNRRSPFTEINMPTRIFEYLAMGKPVVVPDTRGIRDYFGAESALFFEPGDPQSLADVILDVYRNPQKVDSILARGRTVYEAHRWEVHRMQFLDRVNVLLSPGQFRVNP
jgi:glycosyltransferase involved in cell wall biosynthesis